MTRDEFNATALSNPINRIILERLPQTALPDVWLASGAVFQPVWNALTKRDVQYGIKDYDIFYFDPDTSYEAEDAAIRMTHALFADVKAVIEVRNQARVHLWYEQKFGAPYPPLSRATDGIDRFLMPCAQVGVRRLGDDLDVYAPRGFIDIEQMIVRPNRCSNFHPDRYREKANRWKELWPELTILPAQAVET
jgi:hypothetical protein